MKLAHVLCATDGTPHSEAALAFAASLAAASSARLTLLAVQPYHLCRGVPAPLWDDGTARGILDAAAATARKHGVESPRLMEGKAADVAEAILSVAERQGVDHIVLGSGGKGAVMRLLAGSVSDTVVHRANCAVTVVQ